MGTAPALELLGVAFTAGEASDERAPPATGRLGSLDRVVALAGWDETHTEQQNGCDDGCAAA
jgi:hypothetical protein